MVGDVVRWLDAVGDVAMTRRPLPGLYARMTAWWGATADVVRPDGRTGFDDVTGTYTSPGASVASGMACRLRDETSTREVDVAGDLSTLTRLYLEHDPQYTLQVDDRVTFLTHPTPGLVGATVVVTDVTVADLGFVGRVQVELVQPDRRG